MTRRVLGRVALGIWLGCVTATAAQLPPKIMVDRYLLRAERLVEAKEPYRTLKMMNKIVPLQVEHNLTLPAEFHSKYARPVLVAGEVPPTIGSVDHCLSTAETGGTCHPKALALLVKDDRGLLDLVADRAKTGMAEPDIDDKTKAVLPSTPDVKKTSKSQPEADCGQWYTSWYFRKATPESVTTCLEAGADPMARGGDWQTPLHWAAKFNENPAVTKVLLKGGADPTARDMHRSTPLDEAAQSNENPAVIELLLAAGADPTARDNYKRTPLHWAAGFNGNPEVSQALLKAGANPMARDDDKRTPLHWAGIWNPAVIEALLGGGADARADLKWTPLHEAVAINKNPAVIEALIKAGADPTARDDDKRTPLHLAAQSNENPAVIELLLAAGADPMARDNYKRTPLHWAAGFNGNPEVSQALLKAGANPMARDNYKRTPLHLAARSNNSTAVIETLLNAGADPKARDEDKDTPLHRAARSNGNAAVIEALLKAGADPNVMTYTTPLHQAAESNGNAAVTDALLKAGADPTARDDNKQTPLHCAAMFNQNPAVTEALIKAGADPMARDDNERTPLHVAARFNRNPAVVEIVRKATQGAKETDSVPKGAVALAERPGHLQAEAESILVAAERTISPWHKIQLLEEADDKLQRIVDSYPSSELAVKLVTEEGAGSISLAGIQEAIKATVSNCLKSERLACIVNLVAENAKSINGVEERIGAFSELARVLAEAGNYEEAKAMIAKATEAAQSIEDDTRRSEALVTMARAQVAAGLLGVAIGNIELIEDHSTRAKTLVEVARSLAEAGSDDASRTMLAKAAEAAQLIEDHSERAETQVEVARALIKTGDLDQAKAIIAKAAEVVCAMEKDSDRIEGNIDESPWMLFGKEEAIWSDIGRCEGLVSIALAHAEAGDSEGFLGTLSTIRSHYASVRVQAYVSVASALAETEYDEEIEAIIAKAAEAAGAIEDDFLRTETLVTVARAQAEAGDVKQARAMIAGVVKGARAIDSASKKDDALLAVAQVQAKVGELAAALKTALAIEDATKQVRALSTVASIVVERQYLGQVKSTLVEQKYLGQVKEMLAKQFKGARAIDSVQERDDALLAVAQVQAKVGELAAALKTALAIDGAAKRAVALSTVASVTAELGDLEQGKATIAKAVETAGEIESEDDKEEALAAVAEAYIKLGQLAEAVEIARTIDNVNQREDLLAAVVRAHVTADSYAEAVETARAFERPGTRDAALGIVVRVHARAGRFAEAIEILKSISDGHTFYFGNTLVAVVRAQTKAGQLDQAIKAVESIKGLTNYNRISALAEIAAALAETGNVKRAREIIERAEEEARPLRFFTGWFTNKMFAVLARAQAKAGLLEAFKTANSIRQVGRSNEALVAVASALAQAGFIEYARVALLEARRNVEAAHEWTHNYSVPFRIILTHAEADSVADIQEFIDSVTRIAESKTVYKLNVQLAFAASREVSAGNIKRGVSIAATAVETADLLDNAAHRARLLSRAVSVFAKAGRLAEAVEIAKLIDVAGYARANALVAVASALAKAGRIEEARTTAVKAAEENEMVEFPEQRAANYAALSSVLSMAGSDEEATRMIAMAFEVAKSIEESGISSAISSSAARAATTDFSRVFRTHPPHAYSFSNAALNAIVSALVEGHQFAEAGKAIERIEDGNDRARMLALVSSAQVDDGLFDDARRNLGNSLIVIRSMVEQDKEPAEIHNILLQILNVAAKMP